MNFLLRLSSSLFFFRFISRKVRENLLEVPNQFAEKEEEFSDEKIISQTNDDDMPERGEEEKLNLRNLSFCVLKSWWRKKVVENRRAELECPRRRCCNAVSSTVITSLESAETENKQRTTTVRCLIKRWSPLAWSGNSQTVNSIAASMAYESGFFHRILRQSPTANNNKQKHKVYDTNGFRRVLHEIFAEWPLLTIYEGNINEFHKFFKSRYWARGRRAWGWQWQWPHGMLNDKFSHFHRDEVETNKSRMESSFFA